MSITVSLTSTSERLPVLRYTLLSLLEQTLQPDRIALNISRDAYLLDKGISALPDWLHGYASQGIDINWVANTGPYRKLLPVLAGAGDNDILVTCDDDVIYAPDWLDRLISAANAHPDAIVCGRARVPRRNLFGRQQSYLNWPTAPQGSKGPDLVPIGIAGVVYRKRLLNEALLASEDYLKLAPKQDDLWFNCARRINRVPVLIAEGADQQVYPIETPVSLVSSNATASGKPGGTSQIQILLNKVVLEIKRYLGFSVCDNDKVIKSLEKIR